MAQPWQRRAWLVAKLLFSVAVVAYFAYVIDLERFRDLWSRASWTLLTSVVVLSLIRIVIGAWRLQRMLADAHEVPLLALARHYFIGSMFNQLLPTAVGGDAVRVLLLAEVGIARAHGVAYILTERVLGLISLGVVALAGVPFVPLPPEPRALVYLVGLGSLLLALALPYACRSLPYERLPLAALRRVGEALRYFGERPRRLALGLFGSLLFQLVGIAISFLVAEAFALEVPLAAFVALVPLVYLATMVPISVGGVGLRELAFVYFFAFLDVPKEASLIIALGTYVSLLLPGLVGAVVYLHDRLRPRAAGS